MSIDPIFAVGREVKIKDVCFEILNHTFVFGSVSGMLKDKVGVIAKTNLGIPGGGRVCITVVFKDVPPAYSGSRWSFAPEELILLTDIKTEPKDPTIKKFYRNLDRKL